MAVWKSGAVVEKGWELDFVQCSPSVVLFVIEQLGAFAWTKALAPCHFAGHSFHSASALLAT
jgi:hypothetical protein